MDDISGLAKEFGGDLLKELITSPAMIILGIVLIGLIVAIIITIVKSSGFEGDFLSDHLDDEITPNSYFIKQVENCSLSFARKMMKYQHGSDFEPYRRKMLSKLKPMFFCQVSEKGGYPKVKFSQQFVEYADEKAGDKYVRDFYKIGCDYIKFMYRDAPVVVHQSSDFENYLSESLLNEMRAAETLYNAEVATKEAERQAIEDENSSENIKKRIVSAYNATIQEIKSHNNRGLNPSSIESLNDRFLVKLLSLKVFTQQKLFDMTSEQAMEFNGQGCYIIYNPYTKKYFIGQSETMFTRVYTLLTSPSVKACTALKKDIDAGHIVLIKFVSLASSGYSNINRLHRDLILAYDCRGEKGYNK